MPYVWNVNGKAITCVAAGEYTDVVEADCEKTVSVLKLTVLGVYVDTLPAEEVTICETELPYIWNVNGKAITCVAAREYTDVVEANCEKIVSVLKLKVNKPVYVDTTVTECYSYTWYGETYVRDTVVTVTVTGDNGCDRVETLHLTITAETPENNPELAEAEAVAKYGNRLVMLHLNNFVEKYGWTPAAGDVMWYQVNGDVDTSWEVENDTPLGTGYYIDSQEGYTGEVYAVINASTEDKCQNIYRTKVIALVSAGQAPKLMPTIARPSEDLHLMNLNPSNVTEVRVFNTSGELMATYQAEEASEFVFKAATLPGYYMVEVQHNGEQTTLRYIVK